MLKDVRIVLKAWACDNLSSKFLGESVKTSQGLTAIPIVVADDMQRCPFTKAFKTNRPHRPIVLGSKDQISSLTIRFVI